MNVTKIKKTATKTVKTTGYIPATFKDQAGSPWSTEENKRRAALGLPFVNVVRG